MKYEKIFEYVFTKGIYGFLNIATIVYSINSISNFSENQTKEGITMAGLAVFSQIVKYSLKFTDKKMTKVLKNIDEFFEKEMSKNSINNVPHIEDIVADSEKIY